MQCHPNGNIESHDYFLERYYWKNGRLYEVLRCKKCGHISEAWTKPGRKVKTRLAVISIVCAILSSCTFGLNTMGYEVKHGDLESSWKYVASFEYQDDPEGYWKSPMEFERDGGGDCEDFATDLMYYLGPESKLYIVQMNGMESYHAIVFYDGNFIESEMYGIYYTMDDFLISGIYSYKDAMQWATKYGSKDMR